ncbi:hypothetical protein AB0I60_05345 [Actinosynnema sp. NPDC050436]|uniref:hypothetical protein n=1 Tax=Actinosynnema sp. NPDC050436 TaxID=3155659 RepID=UPI0033D6FBED
MTDVVVGIVEDGLTALEVDDAVHDLIEELREVEVDGVRAPGESAPAHTRGAELAETAMIVLQGIVDSGVARMAAERVQRWFARSVVNHVEIAVGKDRMTLTNATAEQQERLVDHFVKATEARR